MLDKEEGNINDAKRASFLRRIHILKVSDVFYCNNTLRKSPSHSFLVMRKKRRKSAISVSQTQLKFPCAFNLCFQ